MSRFKILSVVLVLVVMLPFAASAESFSTGVKAGIVVNDGSFNYATAGFSYDPDNAVGINVSLQVERPLNPFISARLDGGFIQKGFDDDVGFIPESGGSTEEFRDIKVRINYASFALLLKGSLPSGTYFVAGPRLDLKLSVSDDELDFLPESLEDALESTVYGFTVGAGQEFRLTSLGIIFVEIAYQHDLTDLYERAEPHADIDGTLENIENRGISFLVGIRR